MANCANPFLDKGLAMSAKALNLLPNASFELPFGDHICTNWGDSQNELSLHVRAAEQLPQQDPSSEKINDPIDGERAARLEMEESGDGAVAHLLSPLGSLILQHSRVREVES